MERTGEFENGLLRHVGSSHPDIYESILETNDITDETEAKLNQIIADYKSTFGV